MYGSLEVSLPAVPVSVRRAREAVADVAARLGGSPPVVDAVRLCVSEAVTNIVRHAYLEGNGEIRISVAEADSELTVVVRDDGVGLTPFRQEGDLGYGLRIIERLALRYSITSAPNHGTELQMVFALGAREPAVVDAPQRP
jgi:anti-sigma regulatory factor (Ser/Thr protein kinase)